VTERAPLAKCPRLTRSASRSDAPAAIGTQAAAAGMHWWLIGARRRRPLWRWTTRPSIARVASSMIVAPYSRLVATMLLPSGDEHARDDCREAEGDV